MNIKPKRKEVYLYDGEIGRLQLLADKKQWSLKKYMEYVLRQHSKKAMKPIIQTLKAKQ